uniref:Uncharacterized protein n=1 Tax=Anguilla anguilla TaxID=7936 RepID=A0A0E9WEA0_ANGAN
MVVYCSMTEIVMYCSYFSISHFQKCASLGVL